jgi:hypothetical protein
MSDKYNNEEESLLQKIQNKSGCLLLVIGAAMLAFVLTDFVSSGTSIFGSSENNVGSIAGQSITYEEFNGKFEELKNQVLQTLLIIHNRLRNVTDTTTVIESIQVNNEEITFYILCLFGFYQWIFTNIRSCKMEIQHRKNI